MPTALDGITNFVTIHARALSIMTVVIILVLPLDYVDQVGQVTVDFFTGFGDFIFGGLYFILSGTLEVLASFIELIWNLIMSALNTVAVTLGGSSSTFDDSATLGFTGFTYTPMGTTVVDFFKPGQTFLGFLLDAFGLPFPI